MIIDFHTHLFPDRIAARAKQSLIDGCHKNGYHYDTCTDMTVSGLLAHMDRSGVDMSVVLPIATSPKQTQNINEFAATLYEQTGGRIISFGSLHPDGGSYRSDIDTIASLGLKGIKLHAEYQGFSVDEERMLRIYDYAFEKGLMVIHHAGFDPGGPPPFHTTPKQLAHVLDELRGGILIAAHFGGQSMWDDVERYLVGRDIYLDTSMGQRYYSREQFERIVNSHGADKILFASDSPWSDAGDEIALIRQCSLTEQQKSLIFSENAKRLLGV